MSVLCGSCGFCCDGTLFSHAPLDVEEARWARRVSLPVVDDGDGAKLPQPCAALGGDGACRVYEERPRPCRAFVCELLAAEDRGEVTRDAALATIERARALTQRVRRAPNPDDAEALLDAYELGLLIKQRFAAVGPP